MAVSRTRGCERGRWRKHEVDFSPLPSKDWRRWRWRYERAQRGVFCFVYSAILAGTCLCVDKHGRFKLQADMRWRRPCEVL